MRSSNNPSYDKCVPLFDQTEENPSVFPATGSASWNIDCRGLLFINLTGGTSNSFLRLEVTNGDGSTCQLDVPDKTNTSIFLLPLHIKVTDIEDIASFATNSAFGLI